MEAPQPFGEDSHSEPWSKQNTEAGITKVGKVLRVLAPLLANFDRENGVVRRSDWHKTCAEKNDIRILMRNLSSSFDVLPNWEYKSFPDPRDALHARSSEDLITWIIDHFRRIF